MQLLVWSRGSSDGWAVGGEGDAHLSSPMSLLTGLWSSLANSESPVPFHKAAQNKAAGFTQSN